MLVEIDIPSGYWITKAVQRRYQRVGRIHVKRARFVKKRQVILYIDYVSTVIVWEPFEKRLTVSTLYYMVSTKTYVFARLTPLESVSTSMGSVGFLWLIPLYNIRQESMTPQNQVGLDLYPKTKRRQKERKNERKKGSSITK